MKFKDLIDVIGDNDQNIAILSDDIWCGVFPVAYAPKQYHDYTVSGLLPDIFEGSSPFDGVVLKVWLDNS